MALMRSPDGKRPHGRPTSGIEDSSKIGIKGRVWDGVNWNRVV
jgi:hypothetical protein